MGCLWLINLKRMGEINCDYTHLHHYIRCKKYMQRRVCLYVGLDGTLFKHHMGY